MALNEDTISTSFPLGESETYVNETAGDTNRYTIKTDCRAQFFCNASVLAGRASVKKSGATLYTVICAVDASATPAVTDNAQGDVRLGPGDVVDLVLDAGATGSIGMCVFSAREA